VQRLGFTIDLNHMKLVKDEATESVRSERMQMY
jgi:hypothetical protein